MKNNKKGKKTVNYKRIFLIIAAFVVVALILIFASFYSFLNTFNNSSVDLTKVGLNKNDTQKIKNNGKSCNILVMGVDIGTAGSTSANDPKRTDTMILAHYNANDKKVNLISIPRDTLIRINGKNQKINAAHAIGGVIYAVDAVENLLGIQIDYYGKVNYKGFDQLIDAIGGVNVDITRKMDYDDPTQDLSIHFEKGTNVHLDGKKAEEFFRWRKNTDGSGLENGDLGRIQNQHIFITSVMKKIKSPMTIFKIPRILSAIKSAIETNMDAKDILKYAYIFGTINNKNLSMDTIQGDLKTIGGVSYVVYNQAQNEQVILKLNDGIVPSIDKSKLKIKVMNGTKTQGLASDYSTYLVEKGYKKAVTGNGEATSKTKILVYNANKDIKSDLQKDFQIDNIEFLSSSNETFDVIVILGEDHKLMH